MKSQKYRKALEKDIGPIADLVTKLLGTCNLDVNQSINDNNLAEIGSMIDKYFVCEVDDMIVGACGISDIINQDHYNLGFNNIREILYLVVDNDYQGMGIGTKLLELCLENQDVTVMYEAWGDGDDVNSKKILEKCGFKLYKDLGKDYYKNNNYCELCVNKNKECDFCYAQIWIKRM